jgi:hypothetical protein
LWKGWYLKEAGSLFLDLMEKYGAGLDEHGVEVVVLRADVLTCLHSQHQVVL